MSKILTKEEGQTLEVMSERLRAIFERDGRGDRFDGMWSYLCRSVLEAAEIEIAPMNRVSNSDVRAEAEDVLREMVLIDVNIITVFYGKLVERNIPEKTIRALSVAYLGRMHIYGGDE